MMLVHPPPSTLTAEPCTLHPTPYTLFVGAADDAGLRCLHTAGWGFTAWSLVIRALGLRACGSGLRMMPLPLSLLFLPAYVLVLAKTRDDEGGVGRRVQGGGGGGWIV